MHYYFITGSSKGLGRSLLDLLLKEDDNFIYGYARNCPLTHSKYKHTTIDLSQPSKVGELKFPSLEKPSKIVLINNAGTLGTINHVGKLDNQSIIDCYNLNLIAPTILANNFLSAYANLTCEKLILNISSGAGETPIDGWSTYCSSKAGVDMFSQVLNEENKRNKSNVTVLSLSPGLMDTQMQNQIRETEVEKFSNVQRFIDYSQTNQLIQPELTAKKVLRFIHEVTLQQDVMCSVRDL